jgi:enoyl-CoA hydratase/carnithine racemase
VAARVRAFGFARDASILAIVTSLVKTGPTRDRAGVPPMMEDEMPQTWQVMKEWPELILERLADAGVARITYNRPEKRNALNGELVAAFFDSLDMVRADSEIKAVITRGAGKAYSSGLDLHFLREVNATTRDRGFPRIMIAQVHGYCLGGALGIMNCHDIVFAADDAELGMPEILRGSFGQLVTSTLVHGGIPLKKVALMQLVGRNVSGAEADALGIISQAVPAAELEDTTTRIAAEIASRHLAPLEHSKITVQMGRDLSLSQAIQLDQLVGQRLRRAMDPTADVESYLESQKGGPDLEYKRPDV